MSSARPRPIRRNKVQIRFVDAADRANFLDGLDYRIATAQRYSTHDARWASHARRLIRQRRTLRGLVIGA